MDNKELMRKLNRAQAIIDAMYAETAARFGLTFNALMILYIFHEEAVVTQKLICDETYLPKSTVHSIVLQLVADGVIAFSDEKIGKEKVMVLTENGKRFCADVMTMVERREQDMLAYLGEDVCRRLSEASDRLLLYFENRQEGKNHA